MNIILGNPGSGKTKYLLRQSAEFNIPVLCESPERLERLLVKAQGYGYSIPRPITFDELTPDTKQVYIDDVNRLLEALLHCKVKTITVNVEDRSSIEDLDKD